MSTQEKHVAGGASVQRRSVPSPHHLASPKPLFHLPPSTNVGGVIIGLAIARVVVRQRCATELNGPSPALAGVGLFTGIALHSLDTRGFHSTSSIVPYRPITGNPDIFVPSG